MAKKLLAAAKIVNVAAFQWPKLLIIIAMFS